MEIPHVKQEDLDCRSNWSNRQHRHRNASGANIPVRAFVHQRDARSEQLSAQGVEVVQGDLLDFEAVSEALTGITGAYFVYPIQVPGILEATAFFAQAALEQGVGAIVNMSQASARRTA
jgi:uncharacterized protein YbjT (DUF2867 family)